MCLHTSRIGEGKRALSQNPPPALIRRGSSEAKSSPRCGRADELLAALWRLLREFFRFRSLIDYAIKSGEDLNNAA